MSIDNLYISRGITTIDDLNIDNVANCFNIVLLKDYSYDVRVKSNDIDIIMLQTKDLCKMTETFFHELAHVLKHGHTHINDQYRTYCEGQANKLMYELAVPSFLIKENFVDYMYIHQTFNVSKEFAFKRVEQLRQNKMSS